MFSLFMDFFFLFFFPKPFLWWLRDKENKMKDNTVDCCLVVRTLNDLVVEKTFFQSWKPSLRSKWQIWRNWWYLVTHCWKKDICLFFCLSVFSVSCQSLYLYQGIAIALDGVSFIGSVLKTTVYRRSQKTMSVKWSFSSCADLRTTKWSQMSASVNAPAPQVCSAQSLAASRAQEMRQIVCDN